MVEVVRDGSHGTHERENGESKGQQSISSVPKRMHIFVPSGCLFFKLFGFFLSGCALVLGGEREERTSFALIQWKENIECGNSFTLWRFALHSLAITRMWDPFSPSYINFFFFNSGEYLTLTYIQ